MILAKRSVENDRFKNQLKALEKDGTVVHETEHREYQNVNGNAQEKDIKEATGTFDTVVFEYSSVLYVYSSTKLYVGLLRLNTAGCNGLIMSTNHTQQAMG